MCVTGRFGSRGWSASSWSPCRTRKWVSSTMTVMILPGWGPDAQTLSGDDDDSVARDAAFGLRSSLWRSEGKRTGGLACSGECEAFPQRDRAGPRFDQHAVGDGVHEMTVE